MTQAPATGAAGNQVPGRSGTRRRGEALRRPILDATLELLRSVGYAKLTMEGVAAAAGTGKAALYRRWRDRDALVADALRSALPDPTELRLTGNIRDDVYGLLGCIRDTVDLSLDAAYQVVKREARMDSGMGAMVQVRVLDPCTELIAGVLRRGVDAGELRPGVDTQRIAEVGPAMLVHFTVTSGPPIPDDFLVSVVDEVIMPLIRR